MRAGKKRANGEGTVFESNGRWLARYSYYENGALKKKSFTASTEKLAEARLKTALDNPLRDSGNLAQRAPRETENPGHVYFIQGEGGGPIKIGWTINIEVRLAAFQVGSPVILRVLHIIENGGRVVEDELHQRFASSRLHGEWFLETPELCGFINQQCTHQDINQTRRD